MATEEGIDKLLKLVGFYRREAVKCGEAGAHFAGSVLWCAALEAALLAMVVEVGGVCDRKAISWNLSRLLEFAKEKGWLPSVLGDEEVEVEEALSKAEVGDLAEVVRELRNLLHPGKWLREYRDLEKVTKRALRVHVQGCWLGFRPAGVQCFRG